jgi:hypothetical protein
VAAGAIASLSTLVGGTLYTNGSYPAVALTGGSGANATANIVVAGGSVTSVTIVNPGSGYKQGDVLSAAAANIGGTGSGFTITVAGISSFVTCRAIYCTAPGTITYQQGPIGAPGPSTAVALLAGQTFPVELNDGIISSLGAGSYLLLA